MPSSENDKGKSAQQSRDWHDRALVGATVAAAFGAAIAAGANAYQAYLTRQNNVVSQRAFVHFEGSEIRMSIDPTTKAKNVSVFTRLINSGNTATKGLTFFVKCAPSIDSLPDPWVLLFREKAEKQQQIFGPHQTFPAHCAFSLDHMKQVSHGAAHAYLLGEITYRDRLDDSIPHLTQFTWEIADVTIIDPPVGSPPEVAPAVNVVFQTHGRHNCADEDCPKN